MVAITDVVVVHHVDCGMTYVTNDFIRTNLKKEGLGDEKVDSFEFGEILDLEQSVRDDIKFLKASPYIKKEIRVSGYVFDLLKTGKLIAV
jgi:carbonic anhydrase